MPDVWIMAAVAAAVVSVLGLTVWTWRRKGPTADAPGTGADEREDRLARRLARAVGCSVAQALPAVRRELQIAPDQADQTLLKRAEYHYRRDLPDAPCPVFRDRAPG